MKNLKTTLFAASIAFSSLLTLKTCSENTPVGKLHHPASRAKDHELCATGCKEAGTEDSLRRHVELWGERCGFTGHDHTGGKNRGKSGRVGR